MHYSHFGTDVTWETIKKVWKYLFISHFNHIGGVDDYKKAIAYRIIVNSPTE